jgi:hypothetical protein
MIKYLKKLWRKWFGKTEVVIVKHTPTDLPILLIKPKPLHCATHIRFKKSCPACLTAVGVK